MSDKIIYGNPNAVQHLILQEETYLDGLLPDIINHQPPTAEYQIKDEIAELQRKVAVTMQNEVAEQRYDIWDKGFIQYIKYNLVAKEEAELIKTISETVDGIVKDSLPLLMKVKFYFNRPRPYQMAAYYGMALYPYPSASSDSPSYISGHAFQSKLICEVLGNHYPERYAFFEKLAQDIALSRLHMGLHYRSDIDMGIYAAKQVLKNKEFMLKYGL